MKKLFFIITLFLTSPAKSQVKNNFFTIASCTSQSWITGASPGRAGTTYTIKIKLLAPVSFKNIWIGKSNCSFDVQTFFTDPYRIPSTGDSVLLVSINPASGIGAHIRPKSAPFHYKGVGLIQYFAGGKTRYVVLPSFSKLAVSKGF